MSRLDKATIEKHTRTLRELVKRPENKFCADCKRNDPRWASWNLGVFLCIRCSGIHRGMGTHISKVKSIDLDTWTPGQMDSIQQWGNRRANLYWEAHLKAGHIPPEHKMESFIRSKYESRRWALDGTPPADPSVLDDESASAMPAALVQQEAPATLHSSPPSNASVRIPAPPVLNTHQPAPHRLLSTAVADRNQQNRVPAMGRAAAPQTVAPPPQPKVPDNDLFSLDFHAPPTASPSNTSSPETKKDVKSDILSLFSGPPVQVQPPPSMFGQFGGISQQQPQQPSWDQFGGGSAQMQQPQYQAQPTSLIGSNGTGAWGVTSGWNAPVVPPAQGNVWGNPAPAPVQLQQPAPFGGSNVWGSTTSATTTNGSSGELFGAFTSSPSPQKKDDVFGDLWGGFR